MCSQKRRFGGINFPSACAGRIWGSQSRQLLCTAIAILGVATAGRMYGWPIEIDLGLSPKVTSHVSLPFDALNDTVVGGQTMSLNLAISDSEFVRLFTITSSLFDVAITLHTNGTNSHDLLHGTGYLVDSQGMAIPGFGVTGHASGHDLLAIGLFPLLKDENGTPNNDLPRPLDFFGIHFDLTFPDVNNPAIHVTGGEFKLISDPDAVFGVGPGIPVDMVPDSGSTLPLLIVGMIGLLGTRGKLGRSSNRRWKLRDMRAAGDLTGPFLHQLS
jgi:hypothetical protein